MASVNKILLIGNVGRDPEVKTIGETKIATFSIATTEKIKDKTETEWHNIVCFGKLAEIVQKYVTKGQSLYVEGRFKTEKYTAKDGTEKTACKVIANSIQMLSKGEAKAQEQAQQATPESEQFNDMPF